MKRNSRTAICVLGIAGAACFAGGCSWFGGGGSTSKLSRSSNTLTLEPYQQVNFAVSGEQAELLVENRGSGQLALRVPQDQATVGPKDAYTMSVDGSFVLEFYNASRVPTQVRYTGSGAQPVTISMLE